MRTQVSALLVVLGASLTLTTIASGQAQDSATAAAAEALFQQGHQLYEAKRFAEACPKFAESFRLENTTGSLLALASCHEAEGKLASAWSEYTDTVARARRDGRNDRADAADARAAAIKPKLAKVTVMLAPGATEVPGLQVKRDGIVIAGAAFGAPLPVDRGEHIFEASAPGYQTWSGRGTIADGASETVTIPRLLPGAKGEAPPVGPGEQPRAAADTATPSSGGAPLRTIGVVAGVAGLVALGVGGYFGFQAITKNNVSNSNGDCTGDACNATGKQARLDAISAGNVSTALVVVGGALVAGGVVLFIVGGSPSSSSSSEPKPVVAATPMVGPNSAGLSLSGRF